MKKIYLPLLLTFSLTAQAECEQAQAYFKQATDSTSPEQALNYFQQSLQLCENYAAYYEQGKLLFKLNRLDEALNSFKQAHRLTLANSKPEANALARIALVQFKQGALQQAGIYIDKAYDIAQQQSPDWILRLRKNIDLYSADHIASADEINQTLATGKSFGVKPKIKFNSITFKLNSTEFTRQGLQQVQELAKVLSDKLSASQPALLIGHTDKTGTEAYNLTLSERRAEAVKQTLLTAHPELKGLLKTQGKGESELRYLGDTEQDHQLNRRVEVQLL